MSIPLDYDPNKRRLPAWAGKAIGAGFEGFAQGMQQQAPMIQAPQPGQIFPQQQALPMQVPQLQQNPLLNPLGVPELAAKLKISAPQLGRR